ncbi:branched-chain amino acid transaminase [Marivirga sp. S37H4]|uniref:Branched-chain-amino-acid aminotransferase n=1 Tax=Marivirga aurantiaca TaxID=2802615 RepID=A0A934X141_9BACT|nr:branched-chain amino acid transaminase [Marivirga aurantiaca]MBK6266475.1 branched-chain amino acid transaminase [Marivirga aurantiaca]
MYYNNNTFVFLNGQWLPAKEANTSLYGQTLHYGNGVFEGIRAYKNDVGFNIFKAHEHFERLHYSAQLMHIDLPYSVDELVSISYELLDKNNLTDAYIRPLVYLGANMALEPVKEVNVFICAWKWEKYLGNNPIKAKISSYQRIHPASQHVEAKVVGHYTNSILATTEAKKNGYDEAILLDHTGHVSEGSGANIFIEKNGELFTPSRGNILPGITRRTVIDLARELGIKLTEKPITKSQLLDADCAFFTGTAAEVAPIASVDKTTFPLHWEDSLGYNLYQMYRQKVQYNDLQNQTII